MDTLEGLKENVIVGHLIPSGTGFKRPSAMTSTALQLGPGAERKELEEAATQQLE